MNSKSLRQRIRLLLLMLSLALFPLTIFYFSPALPFRASREGIISGSLVVLGILFVTALFCGRFWCGWFCPVGGAQNICALIQPKALKPRWIRFIKYPLFIIWILALSLLLYSAGQILTVDFYYSTDNGVSIARPWQYIIYYSALGVFCGLSLLLGRGASCNAACMMAAAMSIGQKLSMLVGLPRVRLTADPSECSDCKQCDAICVNSVEVSREVGQGEITSVECKKCLACVDVCPKSCIRVEFKAGR